MSHNNKKLKQVPASLSSTATTMPRKLSRKNKRRQYREGVCPSHPDVAPVVDETDGSMECPVCNLLLMERMVDDHNEERNFGNSDKVKSSVDPSRVGLVEDPDSAPSGVGHTTLMSNGAKIDVPYLNRSRAKNKFTKVFSEIRSVASTLELSDAIVVTAKAIYREAEPSERFKTQNRKLLGIVCVYLACRNHHEPKTQSELGKIFDVSTKHITNLAKLIVKNIKTKIAPPSASEFMERFCGNLRLPYSFVRVSRAVAKVAEQLSVLEGRHPKTKAAACFYVAVQVLGRSDELSIDVLSKKLSVGKSAIRDAYVEIYPFREYLIPKDEKLVLEVDDLDNLGAAKNEATGRAQIEKHGLQKTHTLHSSSEGVLKYESAQAYNADGIGSDDDDDGS